MRHAAGLALRISSPIQFLNADVPQLTTEGGIAAFCRGYLGHRFASTKDAVEMTKTFVKNIDTFIDREGLDRVALKKHQRKDEVTKQYLRRFPKPEGVLFVGVAQEKVRVPRTIRKRVDSGGTIPWIIYSTAMINVYYFYCLDQDFGPFFLKFASYFPYTAKRCLNGHEYLKCQLKQRGIAFEALDNGLLACADVFVLQCITRIAFSRSFVFLGILWFFGEDPLGLLSRTYILDDLFRPREGHKQVVDFTALLRLRQNLRQFLDHQPVDFFARD